MHGLVNTRSAVEFLFNAPQNCQDFRDSGMSVLVIDIIEAFVLMILVTVTAVFFNPHHEQSSRLAWNPVAPPPILFLQHLLSPGS